MKTSTGIAFAVIAVIAVVLGLFLGGGMNKDKVLDVSSINTPVTPVAATGGAISAGCPYQNTLAVTGLNAITNAVATPTTVNYFVDGIYKGTTAPAVAPNQKRTVIGDLASYLAARQDTTTDGNSVLVCGANTMEIKAYAYSNISLIVKDDIRVSSNTLFDGTTGNNATQAAAGAFIKLPVIFSGTTQTSTGKTYWIIETPTSSASNVSSITLTLNGQVINPEQSIPASIGAVNAGSTRAAFVIPALVGATTLSGELTITNTATGIVSGLVLTDLYAQQLYVEAAYTDSNGVYHSGDIKEGIVDSSPNGNNAVKYQATNDHDFNIV